ncbi:MAG: NADPH-dependent FMN reductase [Tepidisphaeraceae bacterium]
MSDRPILVISGTNRPGANALKVAKVLEGHYRTAGAAVEVLSLTELPKEVFEGSAYASKPAGMLAIQQRVLDAAGLHVVTPEYNGSFPGVLKYFIDMLKFPESFEEKPVAFTGESAGIWGAIRSVEQLQLIFGYRNAHVLPTRVFIPGVAQKFDADGKLTDAAIDGRLKDQAARFVAYARQFATGQFAKKD